MAKLDKRKLENKSFSFKSSKLKCRHGGDLEYFATDSGLVAKN